MAEEGPATYTLHPKLPDPAATLYEEFLDDVRRCRRQDLCQQDVMRVYRREDVLNRLPENNRLVVQLFFEVLEDLARHGWQFDADEKKRPDGTLRAIAPDVASGSRREQQEIKRRLRAMLVEARNEQLREPSVHRFVRKMERPRWHQGQQVSVQDLFADPQQFSDDLQRRLSVDPPERREALLYEMVDPYLQRVTDDRDEFTNLRLRDIWRYCRYTWSLPQKTQPGRRMQYLVRDAARPFHPIMGIGALGSSIVQISCRDAAIGWELEALEETDGSAERMNALHEELERAIGEIYRTDFIEEGLLSGEEIHRPTDETIQRLDALTEKRPEGGARLGRDVPLEEAARAPLYRYKRAKTLRDLLRARRTFQAVACRSQTASPGAQLECLLATKEGRRALKTALRSQKKRHVGSSMMNITTCGAIPPYNPVLGGKLAGLLMVSPQVIADYNEKYSGTSSHIASRMKGAPLRRRNELVLLETTSLYSVGSSQYNRLRAPAAHGEIRYHEIGQTNGYGSVHLSERTYRTMQQLLREHEELDEESHEFGRGVNYKMRSVSSALSHLGISAVQEHQNPRLVYAIPLASNWKGYLTGRDEKPQLLYDDVEHPAEETDALVDFWKRRWFIKRIRKPMIQRRLKKQSGKVRVSDLVPDEPLDRPTAASPPNGSSSPPHVSTNGKSFMPADEVLHWTTLARLVGGRASFAERLEEDELSALHIRTKLDEGLMEAVHSGKRLYLTGNPGDGKTHFIRRYEVALAQLDDPVDLGLDATDAVLYNLAA